MMSAKDWTSLRGSKFFFAQSSQNWQPVSGEKCHVMISRTWASSCVFACSGVSFCMVTNQSLISSFGGSGNKNVNVIGLGLPNDNKPFVHKGITDCIILWNTMDLGYLTVHAAHALKRGTLRPGDQSMQSGRIRNIEIKGDNILLGTPYIFDKKNIDRFDF